MWLADWRQITEDREIDRLPVHLRQQLASTAERVAVTFALGAQVRERMAAGSGRNVDYYRSRAAWNRAVADFERQQADALRAGRLLAVPWRPVVNGRR
jgi:epoxyqueuosine reductase QueG